uniref:Uncharacterized protein n=1 Tax=Terrapene triunguis TaxID=2587831 RepID=A0A674ICE1_9SAUR
HESRLADVPLRPLGEGHSGNLCALHLPPGLALQLPLAGSNGQWELWVWHLRARAASRLLHPNSHPDCTPSRTPIPCPSPVVTSVDGFAHILKVKHVLMCFAELELQCRAFSRTPCTALGSHEPVVIAFIAGWGGGEREYLKSQVSASR